MTGEARQYCERHHVASIVPEPCPLCEAEKQPWNHEAPLAEFEIAKNWPALARAIGLLVWPPEDEDFPVPSADLMLLLAEAYPNLAAAIFPDDANQEGEARGAAHDLCEILKGATDLRRWQRHVDSGGEVVSRETDEEKTQQEPELDLFQRLCNGFDETSGSK